MKWNWQQPNWPDFTWKQENLIQREQLFLQEIGAVSGAALHLKSPDDSAFMVDLLTSDAMDTARIEGELLDRDSVQSSIQRRLGLKPARRRVGPAEAGMAEMTVKNFQSYRAPLADKTLFAWQAMVVAGREDLEAVGKYRSHPEPMQVVSGAGRRRRVHFEAPPSGAVKREMKRFLEWFNRTAPRKNGAAPLPTLVRAGIAHLWFETIHPFEDGNGRVGRAIAEKAIMQGLLRPAVTALSTTLLRKRKAYYQALEQASAGLEITGWLEWFSLAAVESARHCLRQVEFLLRKIRIMDALRGQINPRQEKALLRLFAAGPDGFTGGLSAHNYASITGASSATVSRDLADLVKRGVLARTGMRKATRYSLAES